MVIRDSHSVSGTVGATTLDGNTLANHGHTAGGSVSSSNGGGTFESTDRGVSYTLHTYAAGGSQPHTHSLSASTGAAAALPPYYALAFVMRL